MNKLKLNFLINKNLLIEDFDFIALKKNIRKAALAVFNDKETNFSEINYNFCSDDEIKMYNAKYLKHNYATDIITFGYDTESDIIISVETVRANAKRFKTAFNEELLRVSIHGLLHLCGYKDKTDVQKKQMRNIENHYLNILKK